MYLFDDPLSALDAQVSRTVFEKCISNNVELRNRLRILRANQVQVLPECDSIMFLENGRIRNSGTYAKLSSHDTAFQQLVDEWQQTKEEQEKNTEGMAPHKSRASGRISLAIEEIEEADGKANTSLMQEEERNTGNISVRTYYKYAIACGGAFIFTLMLLLWAMVATLGLVAQWWLSYSSEQEARVALQVPDTRMRSLLFYIGIYCTFGLVYAILTAL